MNTLPDWLIATFWRLMALGATTAIFLLSAFLVAGTPPSRQASELPMPTKCLGKYNGKFLDKAQLIPILAQHAQFLTTIPAPPTERVVDPYSLLFTQEREPLATVPGQADPFPGSIKGGRKPVSNAGRADLCGVRLTGVDLQGADMRFVRLMGARLENVNLSNAKLDGADLTWVGFDNVTADGARFRWTNMPHALLYNSSFKNTVFYMADLHHAEMSGSDFTDASFDSAQLNSASMRGAVLGNVDFANADFSYVSYEAKPGFQPRAGSFRSVKGLSSMLSHTESAASLRELQQLLESAGMRVEAARVRAAIVSAKGVSGYSFQKNLMQLIYGVPYAYGERPERLLLIVALLVPTFAVFYAYALRRPGNGVIWLIRDVPYDDPERKMRGIKLNQNNCRMLNIALLFSVRSAFRIGWKDFNVGDWLTRMQQQGYRLEAYGWVRSISGFQSLISVYLLALLILSYIGAS